MRAVLAATAALAASPQGFTVGQLAAKVRDRHDHDYTVRQAAYDLRKLRAKQLVIKREGSRRYDVPADAARTITAITALRDQVIAPLLGGVRGPRTVRDITSWTPVEHDYEALRCGMETLFGHLGIEMAA